MDAATPAATLATLRYVGFNGLRSTARTYMLISKQRNCPTPGVAGTAPPAAPVVAGRGAPAGRGGFTPGAGRGGNYATRNNPSATCYKCGGPNHFARDCQAQTMKCYACGKLGHISRDCTAPNGGPLNTAGKSCYKCGEAGHIIRDCPQNTGAVNGVEATDGVTVEETTTTSAPAPAEFAPPPTTAET